MLKRLMIWLLNQFQKVVRALKGRQDGARSQEPPEEVLPVVDPADIAQGSLTRSDINIDNVAPVAQRVSLAPAVPRREAQDFSKLPEPDTASDLESAKGFDPIGDFEPVEDLEPTEDFDTHKRLDATAAALSAEESVMPTMPTTMSELMGSNVSLQATAGDIALPAPTVETQGNYQLPAIYDLLPAIEPEEPDTLEEPAHLVSRIESTTPEETPLFENVEAAVEPPDVAIAEQPILFSFEIYESDTDESGTEISSIEEPREIEEFSEIEETYEAEIDKAEEVSGIEEVNEAEDVDLPVPLDAITRTNDRATLVSNAEVLSLDVPSNLTDENLADQDLVDEDLVDENLADENLTNENLVDESIADASASTDAADKALNDEEQASDSDDVPTLELESEPLVTPESNHLEPLNPWLTATPKTSQPSATTAVVKVETKPGVVKLLFTIKPGNYHGYIAPDDGSKDILFHQKYINADIFDKIERGTLVTATVKQMEGKLYATHVGLREELCE